MRQKGYGGNSNLIKKEDIRVRDPFILLDNGVYYMYGTTNLKDGLDAKNIFSVYTSKDLEEFDGPYVIIRQCKRGQRLFLTRALNEIINVKIGRRYVMYNTIRPGKFWYDTEGKRIQAHGGSLLYANGKYYWYGENKEVNPIDFY